EREAGYAAGLGELRGERREDLAIRIDELEELQGGVEAQAEAALAATAPEPERAGTAQTAGPAETERTAEVEGVAGSEAAANATGTAGEHEVADVPSAGAPTPPAAAASDEAALGPAVLRDALERLGAGLRARTAPGFRLR